MSYYYIPILGAWITYRDTLECQCGEKLVDDKGIMPRPHLRFSYFGYCNKCRKTYWKSF